MRFFRKTPGTMLAVRMQPDDDELPGLAFLGDSGRFDDEAFDIGCKNSASTMGNMRFQTWARGNQRTGAVDHSPGPPSAPSGNALPERLAGCNAFNIPGKAQPSQS